VSDSVDLPNLPTVGAFGHPEEDDQSISLKEAAELIGVHYMTAYRYVRSGRLPAKKVGNGWRVAAEDLRLLVEGEDPETRTLLRGDSEPRTVHRMRLESRLIAGDEPGAWGVLEAAMAAGADPEELLLELLSPSMASIGSRWAAGELSISDEHRASAVAQRLIARLGPRFARRGRKRGMVVIGAVAGDRHSLPTSIMSDLLRGEGLEVMDLGADAPPESFVSCATEADRLIAVALCATAADRQDAIRSTVEALRLAGVTAPIVLGGSAMTDRDAAMALGVDNWAGDASSAIELFNELVEAHRTAESVVASPR